MPHTYCGGGLATKSCRTLVTPWTVARPGSSLHVLPRQEHWSGWPFPSPGDYPDLGVETRSPALQADSLPTEPTREAWYLLEWLVLKRQELTSIGEDVKKREPLCTVDGNVDGSSHHGKEHGGSLKSQQSHFWVYIKRKWNSYFEEVAVHLSSAELFTIAKLWK